MLIKENNNNIDIHRKVAKFLPKTIFFILAASSKNIINPIKERYILCSMKSAGRFGSGRINAGNRKDRNHRIPNVIYRRFIFFDEQIRKIETANTI